uniref:Protein FAR-RED-ELONGATED HYPOCOTYL 1-LIKE n=1 Tax=Noccaea caerulescens TaxID=107243 RepID=A0A1J3IF75_NOCCA
MDSPEISIPSLDHSGDPMIVAEESLDSSKKRKMRAEESDLLPLPKHFCLEQQASLPDSSCPSSDIESAECSYGMEDTNTKTGDESSSSSASVTGASFYMFKDSSYSTGSSSSGSAISSIDQYCSKFNDKTQEDAEDFSHMDFICPESAVQEVLNPVGSYVLSSARWSVSNRDSEEATTKPTIDQEFEQYFSELMM